VLAIIQESKSVVAASAFHFPLAADCNVIVYVLCAHCAWLFVLIHQPELTLLAERDKAFWLGFTTRDRFWAQYWPVCYELHLSYGFLQ